MIFYFAYAIIVAVYYGVVPLGKRNLMLDSLKAFGSQLIEAEISIFEIGSKLNGVAGSAWEFWEKVKGFFEAQNLLVVLAAILLVLSLVEAFAGKKLFPVQKVIACFILGYIIGTAFVFPAIAPHIESVELLAPYIKDYVVGWMIGALFATLCLPIYVVSYVSVIGYFAYSLMMDGLISQYAGDKIVALIGMAVALVFALVFRKIVEIAMTSVIGGAFTYHAISYLVLVASQMQMTDLLGDLESIVESVVIAVVSVAGFMIQYRYRRRW